MSENSIPLELKVRLVLVWKNWSEKFIVSAKHSVKRMEKSRSNWLRMKLQLLLRRRALMKSHR